MFKRLTLAVPLFFSMLTPALAEVLQVTLQNQVPNQVFTIEQIGDDPAISSFEGMKLNPNDKPLSFSAQMGYNMTQQHFSEYEFFITLSTNNNSIMSCYYNAYETALYGSSGLSATYNGLSFSSRTDTRCEFTLSGNQLNITVKAGQPNEHRYAIPVHNNTDNTIKIKPWIQDSILLDRNETITIAPHSTKNMNLIYPQGMTSQINGVADEAMYHDDIMFSPLVSIVTNDNVEAIIAAPDLTISSQNNKILTNESTEALNLWNGVEAHFRTSAVTGQVGLEISPISETEQALARLKASKSLSADKSHHQDGLALIKAFRRAHQHGAAYRVMR